jgi:ribonuclease P protein component
MIARHLRLRRDFDVRQARSRGKAYADGPVVIRVMRNDATLPGNRYGVVAGKKTGGSVQRNRVKRLCREAIRHAHPRLRKGHDVVVIVRGTADELPDQATVTALLERLFRRAGLVLPDPPAAP